MLRLELLEHGRKLARGQAESESVVSEIINVLMRVETQPICTNEDTLCLLRLSSYVKKKNMELESEMRTKDSP